VAGLRRLGDVPRHQPRDRSLPRSDRWTTEDHRRVHHGQPIPRRPTGCDIHACLLPVRHHDVGHICGDVLVWDSISSDDQLCVCVCTGPGRNLFCALAAFAQARQRKRGELSQFVCKTFEQNFNIEK